MTLIVGILCADGVVVGSDSYATYGDGRMPTIGQQAAKKVNCLNDHVVYASTGAVGMAQLVANTVKKMWDENRFQGVKTPESAMDEIGKEIMKVVLPYMQAGQVQKNLTGDASTSLCKSMVAIPIAHQACLFQFDFSGAPERATPQLPFVSLGSGQMIADPFLALIRRLLWADTEPTLAEGRLAAVWAIDHVRRTNAGGVGGDIQLATLVPQKSGLPKVQLSAQKEIGEHLQNIGDAESALVDQIRGKSGKEPPALPASPQP
jgi:hypothetical protein